MSQSVGDRLRVQLVALHEVERDLEAEPGSADPLGLRDHFSKRRAFLLAELARLDV